MAFTFPSFNPHVMICCITVPPLSEKQYSMVATFPHTAVAKQYTSFCFIGNDPVTFFTFLLKYLLPMTISKIFMMIFNFQNFLRPFETLIMFCYVQILLKCTVIQKSTFWFGWSLLVLLLLLALDKTFSLSNESSEFSASVVKVNLEMSARDGRNFKKSYGPIIYY